MTQLNLFLDDHIADALESLAGSKSLRRWATINVPTLGNAIILIV